MRVALTLEQCWQPVPGGTAVAALELARELDRRDGISVIGVSAAHHGPAPAAWRPSIPVRQLGLPREPMYLSWHYARRPAVQGATGPVDVIHATALAIPPRTAPLVLTLHDLAFLDYPEHASRWGNAFFRRALEIAKRDVDLVLCSSLATVERAVEYGLPHDRLRHVPLGVDVVPATPADVARVRATHGLEGRYVLWVGTVEPRKNLPRLLQAFRAAPADVELVLVGPKGWNEDLETRLATLPRDVRDRVRLLGFVPHADLGPLYAGAAAFCFPSLLEGFGFPVVEAMAQGTPVVTSLGTSTAEVAGAAGLLVDPKDADAIGAALDRVLGDETLARQLGETGRVRASTYTWRRSADLVMDAYRDVSASS